jgi:hypothetical protein
VSPDSFGVGRAINFLLIAVLGGAQTVAGTVFGSLFVTMLPSMLTRFGDIHALLFAVLLIVTVIYLPLGFGGTVSRWWAGALRARRAASGLSDPVGLPGNRRAAHDPRSDGAAR